MHYIVYVAGREMYQGILNEKILTHLHRCYPASHLEIVRIG